ncbi:MAG TPA: hypothetical protein VFX49_06265 [Chloroflexota bacterium]|nr:hypothetical protein [Chloroflexota bacterium]
MEGPIAIGVVALLVLLDVLALRWGADSRDGFGPRGTAGTQGGRLPMTFDPFFAELRGRQHQEELLAEAARERLVLQARGQRGGRGVAVRVLVARLVVRAVAGVDAALRAAVGLAGAALVATGTRLQRLALGQVEPTDLEPAAC